MCQVENLFGLGNLVCCDLSIHHFANSRVMVEDSAVFSGRGKECTYLYGNGEEVLLSGYHTVFHKYGEQV